MGRDVTTLEGVTRWVPAIELIGVGDTGAVFVGDGDTEGEAATVNAPVPDKSGELVAAGVPNADSDATDSDGTGLTVAEYVAEPHEVLEGNCVPARTQKESQ